MPDLERALADVAQVLEGAAVPYMIIGGLANSLWGKPRATVDIDVTVALPVDEVPRLLHSVAGCLTPLAPDPIAFVRENGVLPMVCESRIRVDLLFAASDFTNEAIARAVPVEIRGANVRFCTAEDLVLHKIVSSRSKDREDVTALLRMRRDSLDREYLDSRVRELAEVVGDPAIEERYFGIVD